jgi:hypothetical protein
MDSQAAAQQYKSLLFSISLSLSLTFKKESNKKKKLNLGD